MKQKSLLFLLAVFCASVLAACSRENEVAADSGPIVGQWDINRYTISNLPASYSTLNGTVSTNLGTDTYTFRSDSTYSEEYSPYNSSSKSTEEGRWSFRDTLLTLRPNPASGQVTPYTLKYARSTGEMSTGPFKSSGTVVNPTTQATETVNYQLEFFYRKRY
ncbi:MULTISPECIES: lipocalin family protein [Spirosoma]|uniref:Lipocalin family protein n=1 Tax=Spirosoma liriopis TaxID=2937440 RepID=A0ABT0HQ80_9BACT|nr:lipocalin family protein [Spirosoma oryzicola]MCK8494324.1 lipocalin family protein [Spirosoma liriopis]UHG89336.1 lipocalin family protein [Spirosoma oryzicola]